MSHPDATVKPSVGHIRLFGGMDVKGSNVVRVPPPHPGVGGVRACVRVCVCACVRFVCVVCVGLRIVSTSLHPRRGASTWPALIAWESNGAKLDAIGTRVAVTRRRHSVDLIRHLASCVTREVSETHLSTKLWSFRGGESGLCLGRPNSF